MTRNNWRMISMAALAGVVLAACSGDETRVDTDHSTPPASGSPSAPIDAGPQPGNPSVPAPPPVTAEPPPAQPETPAVPGTGSEPPVAAVPGTDVPDDLPPPEPEAEAPAANRPPSISGSAAASTLVGAAYSFSPSAADPDGDALSWSVTGKPVDATFSTATGELSWTPQSAGVWSGIVVTVMDSKGASSSLQPFSITVEQPVVHGKAAIRWEAPVDYSDGTALPADALAGYRIYHGTSESTLASVAEVDPLTTSLTVEDLEQGMHYFAVIALSGAGEEGERSAIVSKTIP